MHFPFGPLGARPNLAVVADQKGASGSLSLDLLNHAAWRSPERRGRLVDDEYEAAVAQLSAAAAEGDRRTVYVQLQYA